MRRVAITVNGVRHEAEVEPRQLLVYLQAPAAAAKTVALLGRAPTQEEQIEYARDRKSVV